MLNVAKSIELINKVARTVRMTTESLCNLLSTFDKYPRVYHSSDHILDLCEKIVKDNHSKDDEKILIWVALFHDAVYDPKGKMNKEQSANLFLVHWTTKETGLSVFEKDLIYQMILDTKTHEPKGSLSQWFCLYDLSGFAEDNQKILEGEHKIRKEYSWVDWTEYKKAKLEFLTNYRNLRIITPQIQSGMDWLAGYIKNEQAPRIGVYAGSFNPFHTGHKNILEQAEKVFDKVIVAYGTAPDKYYANRAVPEYLKYHQVDFYYGSLPEYLVTKQYPVTVIRGLRNSIDLQFELNQYRWLQEVMKEEYGRDIQLTSFFCDKEFEHISSSAIRQSMEYKDLSKTGNKHTVA